MIEIKLNSVMMRNIKSFFSLFLFTLLFVGCDNDVSVILKESGTLTAYVLDENNVGINGADFYLYGSHSINEVTDADGIVSPVKLLQGVYHCGTSIKVGNVIYEDEKAVQVFVDENAKVELKPFENVGNLSVSVTVDDCDVHELGLKVALLTNDYYHNDFSELIQSAYFIKELDRAGKATFEKVPCKYYYVLLYNETSYNIYGNISIGKDRNEKIDIYIPYWY